VPDNSFEFALERMYAEAPRRPDTDLFTARVLERLDRGWTARRLLIGAMGALGGLIGAGQLLGADTARELAVLDAQSSNVFAQYAPHVFTGLLGPGGAQTILTVAALAVVAAGFGVARLVREI
jgi:hypothetical protein